MAETKTREDLLAAAEERLAEELAKIPRLSGSRFTLL